MSKKSNWLSAYEAIPLSLKLPLEITRFKLDQFGAGQAAANAGFIDLFATVSSSRAEGAQLVGGECGHGLFLQIRSGPYAQARTKPTQGKAVEFDGGKHANEAGKVEQKTSKTAAHDLRLLLGRLWQIPLTALDSPEVVDQGLDGLHSGVFALGVVCDFSGKGFGNACLVRYQLPAGRARLFQTALEVFND